MIKTLTLVVSCSVAAFAVGSGVTVHSPLQISLPFGAAIKTTPDPANVWSWSKEITVPSNQTVVETVLVDFDGDGRMDSNNAGIRVFVTDYQCSNVSSDAHGARFVDAVLRDSQGVRWDISPIPIIQYNHLDLATPIVVPLGSPMSVEVRSRGGAHRVRVSLIGRVVNL